MEPQCSRCLGPATVRVVTRQFGEELVCADCAAVLRDDEQTLSVDGRPTPRFAVYGQTADGASHRYCVPCPRAEAERVASQLRASGRQGVIVSRWPAE